MIFESEIISRLSQATQKSPAFALWMMPGSDCVNLEVQGDQESESSGRKFVYLPWLAKNKLYIGKKTLSPSICSPSAEPSIGHEEYLNRVSNVVAALALEGGKTVISRVITQACDLSISEIIEIASDYFEANPGAFRCLFTDTDGSIWMTATPELLLSYDSREQRAETMALAGTQPMTEFPVWDIKNIEEHGFVVDYIMKVFRSMGLEPERQVSKVLESAGIYHLCTPVGCGCRLDSPALENLLGALNPTPAVCGFPKEKALSLIRGAEIHHRGLYAGYVGVETAVEKKYFVNLRTCRFTKDHYSVYVGGGITSKSVPADEWSETCLKASCMLDILRKHGQKVSDPI